MSTEILLYFQENKRVKIIKFLCLKDIILKYK